MPDLIAVKNLRTYFETPRSQIKAVDGVSFSVAKGESVGLVGESGSGKSVLALSLLRLVPKPGKIVGGEIWLQDSEEGPPINLLSLTERQMRDVRGDKIAMIFQEPMTSLNPVFTIGNQIGEAIAQHQGGSRKEIRDRTLEMLDLVKIPHPHHRIDDYPHQLSGGQRQRVMIAMALACNPALCDEPTTALDVTIQAQILELLADLQARLKMALLMITHDFGVVAQVADRVLVMHDGHIVEEGTSLAVFKSPKHPYTQSLLKAIPTLKLE